MDKEFTEENDRIPDDTLVKLLALYDRLPSSWRLKSTTAYKKSVSVTFAFDGVPDGPHGQAQAVKDMLTAAACLGTLVRNVQRERDRIERLRWGRARDAQLHHKDTK